MMCRHIRLSSELIVAIAKRLPQAKNQLSAPRSFFKQFVTDIYLYIFTIKTRLLYIYIYIYIYTSALRLLALRGWRTLCVRQMLPSVAYKGDNISKYVHLSVKTDFTRKITKFVNFKIFDA